MSEMHSICNDANKSVHKPNSIDLITVDELSDQYSLPSARIRAEQLKHLSPMQRDELLKLLDEFASCFSEKPGFCPYIEHHINISPDFRPKRLKEYRIPEILKPEIPRQIDELLKN